MSLTTQQLHGDEILLNIGPQHPSTHGVLRLVARTDGEVIRELRPHLGYLHRCAEKIGEKVEFNQYIPYTDRMDYLTSACINLGYCLAIEKLCNIEVPERAQHMRVVLAELNRIGSHCIAYGTYLLDLGAFTPFFYGFREREMILSIFEKFCGARLTYSCLRIGGCMRDFDQEIIDDIRRFCDHFESKWPEYNTLVTDNEIFVKRTANVGIITAAEATNWGLTGPCLRGSGVAYDIRKAVPYSGYEKYQFDVPVGKGLVGTVGDCFDRYYVRVQEMMQSIRIIRQALDMMPEGPFIGKVKKIIKAPDKAECAFRSESSRGELNFYLVGSGDKFLYRCRVRGPSFCNLAIASETCRNVLMADVMAVIGALDIVIGETDR